METIIYFRQYVESSKREQWTKICIIEGILDIQREVEYKGKKYVILRITDTIAGIGTYIREIYLTPVI